MTTTAAQDEFNELMRDKGRESRHPEDRHDHDSDLSEPESPSAADDYLEKIDTDDELDLPADMRSNYYMPSHIRSEANTGPKGVIADAQAFEQARKQARRFTWKKSNAENFQANSDRHWADKDASSEEEDEGFMKEWRAARLRELQNVGQRIRSRTNSPSRRIYGGFPLVDAEGYLDAIDKSSPETTVVVFVFGDDSEVTRELEACMREVAQRNDTTRFVKLHNSDAEMTDEGLPAVLAYKGGKELNMLVPLLNELPDDSELSAVSLETCFRRSRIL
ncbi:thioredoxin-like protein [Ophiobolus disseminans]|uniref:Thioredoxin-like protein n=1 Tax=Ophiobolus disseminans TaxID=1469910 RepID=A0A6A6ZXL0_9PLEO|nr:thioredoxin-like protein [Ophiobolus disseminans]